MHNVDDFHTALAMCGPHLTFIRMSFQFHCIRLSGILIHIVVVLELPELNMGSRNGGTHIFDLQLCIQWYIWFCCISRIDKIITNWKVYDVFLDTLYSTLPKWHWSYSCYITVRKQACPLNVLLFWATYPGTISRLLWDGVPQWIWQFFLSALNWRFWDYIEFFYMLFAHHMFCLAWVTLQAGYLLAFRDIWFAAKYYGTHERT